MRRTTTLLALLALAVGVLAGCGEDDPTVGTGSTATSPTSEVPDPSTPQGALAAAESRWADTGIVDYDLAYDVVCFCPQITVRVAVRGGEVESTSVVAPGFDGDTAALVTDPLTVEAMFGELRDAYEGGAAAVEVTYDPDTGRPTQYWIDEDEMIADEEHGVTVVEFTVAGEEPPPTTGTTQAPLTQALGTAQLTESWGCGTGFNLSDAEQTVAVRLGWEGSGAPPAQVALPDPSWSAEVLVGADLFANWCDDVLEPGEPTADVGEVLEVTGGVLTIAEPPSAPPTCPSSVTAVVRRLTVTPPDGSTFTFPELTITNDAWGCVAG